MELPDHLVVGQAVLSPGDNHGVVARTLRNAIVNPAVGGPRQPDAIRIADHNVYFSMLQPGMDRMIPSSTNPSWPSAPVGDSLAVVPFLREVLTDASSSRSSEEPLQGGREGSTCVHVESGFRNLPGRASNSGPEAGEVIEPGAAGGAGWGLLLSAVREQLMMGTAAILFPAASFLSAVHVRNGLFDVLFSRLGAPSPPREVAQIFHSATTERLHNLPEIGC